MRPAILFVALIACGKSDDKSKPPAKNGEPAKAEPSKTAEPAKAEPSAPTDLCKAFDKDAVAAAFGWTGMQKIVGTGTKHGDKISRNCGYRALGDNVKDAGFGADFTTDLVFEKKHVGFGLTFKPREPIDGMEAWSASNDTVTALQVLAKGIRIETYVNDAGPAAEAEPKLIEATKKLVATLPAEPASLLRK